MLVVQSIILHNYCTIIVTFLAIIDDSESTVPLLNGINSGSIPVNDTRGEQKQPIAHTMESPPESAQDKTDTVTDPNGEMRDLSIYKSV